MNQGTEEYDAILDRTKSIIDRLEGKANLAGDNSSSSTISVNAGGAGIWACAWIASLCCVAMFVAGGMFLWSVSSQMQQQDAKIAALEAKIGKHVDTTDQKLAGMQDYLNAIYVQAPSLRPKEQK